MAANNDDLEALRAEIDRLRDDNPRLIALLDGHSTRYRETGPGYAVVSTEPGPSHAPFAQQSVLSTAEKVADILLLSKR